MPMHTESPQIESALCPSEIARLADQGVEGTTCVVFDILRATTSFVTALAHDASRILPVRTIEEAKAARATHTGALLGGERGGNRIEGFDLGNSPFEYTNVAGREIISTTTNGTLALRACAGADTVLAASFLNLRATAEWLLHKRPPRVLLLCAGTFETFAIEDAIAAGALLSHLPDTQRCDASVALANLFLSNHTRWQELVRNSRNGRALAAAGRSNDIEWALRLDECPLVAIEKDGWIQTL